MIEVRYGRFELSLTGHADATCGFDPVCAAVSTLVQSLVKVLLKHDGSLWRCYIELDKGLGVVTAVPFQGHEKETERIFEVAVEGIKLLCEDFPRNIVIAE